MEDKTYPVEHSVDWPAEDLYENKDIFSNTAKMNFQLGILENFEQHPALTSLLVLQDVRLNYFLALLPFCLYHIDCIWLFCCIARSSPQIL